MKKKRFILTALIIALMLSLTIEIAPASARGQAIIWRTDFQHVVNHEYGRPCPRTYHSQNVYTTYFYSWRDHDVIATVHVVLTTTIVMCSEAPAPTAIPPRPTMPPAATPRPTDEPDPPCIPEYAEPTLTLTSVTPPYPIPIGQDPEDEGFDVMITAQGGAKTNSCPEGPARANLTSLSVESVNLSPATISWIEDELSQSYPGAHVLDSYPLLPTGDVSINGSRGTLSFHVDSFDPGTYIITVEARQDRGSDRTNSETFNVRVWLMEGTIWGGGGN